MSSEVTPMTYEHAHLDPHEPFDEERGLEQCPRCGGAYSGNGLYYGPVYDTAGRRYQSPGHTSPGTRMYHPDCWKEHQAERDGLKHVTLDGWTGGDARGG